MELKELIFFCITTYGTDEASERIAKYIEEALDLKEKEVELKNIMNKNGY